MLTESGATPLSPAPSPHLHEVAEWLFNYRGRLETPVGKAPIALIEKLLSYAASAEQQIAEQQQRIAQLQLLSTTDELTGLGNRRGFEEFLRRVHALAQRHNELGVIAYVDLNNFKRINDTYGHDAGDAVLCRVATILSHNTRLSDYVARLHGDEFGVVLVRVGHEQGSERITRLQKMVNAAVVNYAGHRIRVRASFGVAGFGPDCNPHDVLLNADRAMYRQKRSSYVARSSAAAE